MISQLASKQWMKYQIKLPSKKKGKTKSDWNFIDKHLHFSRTKYTSKIPLNAKKLEKKSQANKKKLQKFRSWVFCLFGRVN